MALLRQTFVSSRIYMDNAFYLGGLIAIVIPLWIIKDLLKEILKELKNGNKN